MTQKRLEVNERKLEEVLVESRRLGFLGPGDIAPQVDHSRRFGAALMDGWSVESPHVADLGAGGGVPSLPIAFDRRDVELVLVDASAKRTSFLVWASLELSVSDRVEVWTGRAEEFAHLDDRRGAFDGVVARGFGPPSATLECAGPLLRIGGRCVISEPPGHRHWPVEGLALVGLTQIEGPEGFAVFERTSEGRDGLPRSARELKRQPLFSM